MDFFLKNLKETIEAINSMIGKNSNIITVRRIRMNKNIKSSDRSKINFIWRSLKFLAKQGILEINGSTNPKKYIIRVNEKIDFNEFLSQKKEKIEPSKS